MFSLLRIWLEKSVESFYKCFSNPMYTQYQSTILILCPFHSLVNFAIAAAAQHLHHNADRLKPKRSFLQSIFCCWRKARTKTTQNGTPIDGTITPPSTQGSQKYLLPQVRHSDMHKKCMVIDLDETLVHSSFKVSTVFILAISMNDDDNVRVITDGQTPECKLRRRRINCFTTN